MATSDLIGQVYGMLTIVERAGSDIRGRACWRCLCECGRMTVINGANVKRQHSCGCVRIGARTHSISHLRCYGVWRNMMSRCGNPRDRNYHHYGGRGIKVCDRWHDVTLFYEDMGEPDEGMTIERLDVNGGYSKENCTWLPKSRQNDNKRCTMVLEGLSVKELAVKYSLTEDIVRQRIYRDVPMSHKARSVQNLLTFDGVVMNQTQLAEKYGVNKVTLSWRLSRGWSLEEALGLKKRGVTS